MVQKLSYASLCLRKYLHNTNTHILLQAVENSSSALPVDIFKSYPYGQVFNGS